MAVQSRRLQQGQYYILSRRESASPDVWIPIACLTTKSFKSPTKTIDVTSDCGPDQLAALANQTVDIAGFVDYDSSDSESGQNLYELQQDTQNQSSPAYHWRIYPGDAITGDQSLEFDANISNFQEDFNTDTPVSFSATLGVQGTVTQEILA